MKAKIIGICSFFFFFRYFSQERLETCIRNPFSFFLSSYSVLGIKPVAFCTLDKPFSTELFPWPSFYFFIIMKLAGLPCNSFCSPIIP